MPRLLLFITLESTLEFTHLENALVELLHPGIVGLVLGLGLGVGLALDRLT